MPRDAMPVALTLDQDKQDGASDSQRRVQVGWVQQGSGLQHLIATSCLVPKSLEVQV